MPVAAALHRDPEGDVAATIAADTVAVELAGAACDLAVVVVSGEHVDALGSIAGAVQARLAPGALIGIVAQGVIGPVEEVERGPAVAVWAASLGRGSARSFRTWAVDRPEAGLAVVGWPDTAPDDVTLLFADPFSYPTAQVVQRVSRERGGVVIGGMVTGGRGATRFWLDGEAHEDGAIGVVLHDVDADVVVAQGCRPIGDPFTVTGVDGNVLLELGGEPALDRLEALFERSSKADRARLNRGLQLGVVADEYRHDHDVGDFLIRAIIGADEPRRGIAVGDHLRVGQTVQFQVRDAVAAHDDLLARVAVEGAAAGSLLFTCTGRGANLFGEPDHDVRTVSDALGSAIAGAFCAGEIGPVGSESSVHAFTASVLILRDP